MKKIFLSLIAIMACMSINAQIVKVYVNGELSATYTNSASSTYKVIAEEATTGTTDGHNWVKIGGAKWATMNLGATTVAGSPSTCYGNYYAWGETEPRYTSISIASDNTATFGDWKEGYSDGYKSYPTYTGETLDADHDAATQKWGSDWRTPTNADFQALAKACTGSSDNGQIISTLSSSSPTGGIYRLSSDQTYLSEYTGVAGILCVDKTDTSKRVFFPAAGQCNNTNLQSGGSYGYYWSSSLYTETDTKAYNLYCSKSTVNPSYDGYRYRGFAVRPVLDEEAKQVVKVYENGSLCATYVNSSTSTVKVVFEQTPDAKNLIPGTFSVSATKKVRFTKGNLYWDGSAFKFEENQTDYSTSWNTSHVGYFFWTNITDYQSGTAAYMPYAEEYSSSSQSASDKFWCGEDNPLTVEGSSGLYALTGKSSGEWGYLITGRTNASSLCKYGVTVTNNGTNYTNCLIIAPDDFTGTLQSSYTLDEVNAAGLVCLPAAGMRASEYVTENGSTGYYWSATPYSNSSLACYQEFTSTGIDLGSSLQRTYGQSLRLVKTVSE